MIENCKFQPTSELNSGGDSEKMDSQEGMLGMGLTSTFHTILMQCSPQIFEVCSVEITDTLKLPVQFKICTSRYWYSIAYGVALLILSFVRGSSSWMSV